MFCPGCGLEERGSNQFCRACGTDLRPVRFALEKPDNITASAISARDEIGRAVAAKIRETQSVYELKKDAEDVLPEIEKFLESPAEKRLRRMRRPLEQHEEVLALELHIYSIFRNMEYRSF